MNNGKEITKKIIKKGLPPIVAALLLYVVFSVCLHPLLAKNSVSGNTVAGTMSASNERVRIVEENEEALEWRLRLIGAAETEIIYSTFEMHYDNSARLILAALTEAAERGVRVKLLLDGIGGKPFLSDAPLFVGLAAHECVEIKFYNPMHFTKLWTINYRMHDKYVIIDRQYYMLGGRNTHDKFLGAFVKDINRDREALVYSGEAESSSVQTLLGYFDSIWNEECSEAVNISEKLKNKLAEVSAESFEAEIEKLDTLYPERKRVIEWENDTFSVKSVGLLSADTSNTVKQGDLFKVLSEELMQASHSVIIETPYFIANKAMLTMLERVAASSEECTIITNGLAHGANVFGCANYFYQRDELAATGAGVLEYTDQDNSLHAKAILVDDNISIIGSFNMDPRSVYLDTELMLVIDSEEINHALRTEIFKYAAEEEQEIGFWKTVGYAILGAVVRAVRFLL